MGLLQVDEYQNYPGDLQIHELLSLDSFLGQQALQLLMGDLSPHEIALHLGLTIVEEYVQKVKIDFILQVVPRLLQIADPIIVFVIRVF